MSNTLNSQKKSPDYIEYDYSLRFTALRLWIIYAVFLFVVLLFGFLAAKAGRGILRIAATVFGAAAALLLFRGVRSCLFRHIGNELYRMKKRWPGVLRNALYTAGGIALIVIAYRVFGGVTGLQSIFLILFFIGLFGGVALKGLIALISHAIDHFFGRKL